MSGLRVDVRGLRNVAMEFPVDCECGARMMVREGQAGAKRSCECGRIVKVPPLHELRRSIGMSPHLLSPELVIEHLAFKGELPRCRTCACCGSETDQHIFVVTECERAQVQDDTRFHWLMLLAGFWGIIFSLALRGQDRREYGKDKIYTLPLTVCPECQCDLRGERQLKEALRHVPEYNRLLNKFPDALVRLNPF